MKHRTAVCVAVVLGLACASTQAREYSILIYETPQVLAEREGSQADAYWGRYNAFAGELASAGVLRGGTALDVASGKSGTAGAAGGQRVMGDAQLSGYFIIDAADRDAATRWAGLAPATAARVEVLPHRANPTMAKAK